MVSREDWTLPRWAREADGTDNTSNVTAPTSQKQDSGWTSSDVPVREWWNWLLRETGKGLDYFKDYLSSLFAADGLAREWGDDFSYSGGAQVVDVDQGAVYLNGERYEVAPAAVSCPTQVSQATMHRIIYAHLSSGVAVLAKADGASSGVDPVLSAGQIPICRVRQGTGVATITSGMIDDLREFGRIAMGRGTFDRLSGDCLVVDPVDTADAAVARRYRRKIIPARALRVISGGAGTYGATGFTPASDTVAEYGIEELPPGAILTKMTVAATASNTTNEAQYALIVQSRLTGTTSSGYTESALKQVVFSTSPDVDSRSLGDFVLSEDDMVIVRVAGDADVNVTVHSISVEYIDERPILSFPKL